MNKEDILYETIEEKEATERVLALVRTRVIAREIDELVSEIISYASNIDKILERNGMQKRYLERVGTLDDLSLIYLDGDLEDADFRVKEVVEDLIKRINTRITLVKSNDEMSKELKSTYNVNEESILEDIEKAKLNVSDFTES